MNDGEGRPPIQRELLEFGAGSPDQAVTAQGGDDSGTSGSIDVDAGGFDRDRDRGAEADRAARWSTVLAAGRRLDRSRAFATAAVLITVTALNLALVGWVTREAGDGNAADASSSRATHGLTEDQASCFAFSRAEARIAAVLGAISPIGIGPERAALRDEVAALDAIGADYPSADYRLIVAFHEVGNSSVKLLRAGPRSFYSKELENQRYMLLVAARETCDEIAGFDTQTSTPITS
jgi:hypothetical protein